MTATEPITWVPVCVLDDLVPDRGAAVLVGDHPVALFRLAPAGGDAEELHAVDHLDPVTGAPVIARGLVGSTADRTYVASPLHKQRYDLATGECLDDERLALRTWTTRVRHGVIEVGLPSSDAHPV